MSNNIPVNGWPQLKDLEAVQPILNRLDKIEAWKRTVKEETFTGDDITIENALALPARSLVTIINAIQDLHGYDHPWAGGADKNLFDKDATGIVNNASIAPDGTTTPYDRWSVSDYIPVDATTDYAYSNIGISDTSSVICAFYDSSKAHISNSSQTGATRVYTTPANTAFVRFEFYTTASNTMMFEKGSTASTYSPYSNICPISGRTEARVDTENEDSTESAYAVIQLGTTVYGAEINWDTGVMTVDSAYVKAKDLTWRIQSSAYARFVTSSLIDTIKKSDTDYVCISDSYESRSNQDALMNYNQIYVNASGDVKIGDVEYASSTIEQWLATRGETEIVYKLATPTTLQLTPTMLEMLKGYNRITLSDGYGTIELKALTGANWS